MLDAQRSLRGYLLNGDGQFIGAYDAAAAEFAPAVTSLRRRVATGAEGRAVDEQVRRAALWWAHADRTRQVPPRSEEAARSVESGGRLFEAVLVTNAGLDADLAVYGDAVRRRSEGLQAMTLIALVVLTVLAVLVAVVTAARATARITRPLESLVTVLGRLARGEHSARAPPGTELAEVADALHAANSMADEAARVRSHAAEQMRLTTAAYQLGIGIRQHLSVDAALDEAAAGLGRMVAADHVVIRLSQQEGGPPGGTRWSGPRVGSAPLADPTAALATLSPEWILVRDGKAAAGISATDTSSTDTSDADTSAADSSDADSSDADTSAAQTPAADTVGGNGGDRAYVWAPPYASEECIPPEERAALRKVGATAVLTVAFHGGSGPAGAVSLIRCAPDAGWTEQEVLAAQAVTADLGRGLLHAQLYERERDLVARLRDLDNAKTDFMSTVSHELRTPLTSIAGYLEILADGDAGELNKPQRRMLTVIERNTVRLQVLIEDLLVLSRIEAGTLRTNLQEVEYGWLVTSATAAVSPAIEAAGLTIESEVGGALTGRGDAEQIDRVLTNLLSNAVKFTPRGGTVRISADRDGEEAVIQISDTGIGVPESDHANLFTRFFRARNAVEGAIPGTGLGLAIARTIVAHHGGHIRLVSEEGMGTTITVRLPL
jgi:signal transduction histidine kinase